MFTVRNPELLDPAVEPLARYVEGVRPEEVADPLFTSMKSLMSVMQRYSDARSPASELTAPIAANRNWHHMRDVIPEGLPWSASVAAIPFRKVSDSAGDNRHYAHRNIMSGRVTLASLNARDVTWGDTKVYEADWEFQRMHSEPETTAWFFSTHFGSDAGKRALRGLMKQGFVMIDRPEKRKLKAVGGQEDQDGKKRSPMMVRMAPSHAIRLTSDGEAALQEMVERLTEQVPAIEAHRAAVRDALKQ